MQNILASSKNWFRWLLLASTVFLILYGIPKQGNFPYQFEKGKQWQHENLQAPFSFPIQKTEAELQEDRQEIKSNFTPYYRKQPEQFDRIQQKLIDQLEDAHQSNQATVEAPLSKYREVAVQLLKSIYKQGVIDLNDAHAGKGPTFEITVVRRNAARDIELGKLYTPEEAKNYMLNELRKINLDQAFFEKTLLKFLKPNISYEKALSRQKLNSELEKISINKGMVKEGEQIIAKGDIVSEKKYQILQSLKKEYQGQITQGESYYFLYAGYGIVTILIISIFAIYINYFKRDVYRSNKSLILILINIVGFILLTGYLAKQEAINVYIIPYAIVPIILLAFFGPRIAIIAHIVIVLISSLVVPNGLEFTFLQIMAGFMSILAMTRIRYLSQFFIASILILLSYVLNYTGLSLIQVGNFEEIAFNNYLWFTGNFILTLLAYPLIYAFEKLFGFVSDITLMEYSDINKKLLRRLSMKAPGTFQHSLQVANLSETVLNEIGGNALLARVGALYHDIGKMEHPEYFIENQKYLKNPHDDLKDEESAKKIIEHVTKGVEMAKQYGLPEQIIKFIRTHHGSSRVEYFYRNYLKNNPKGRVDEGKFRYPGPKPFSKETAVGMLVDSVEAASRSLQQPNEQQLEELIDRLIDGKLEDKQLDNADITMREINIIRNRLKKLMKSIFHVRVQYPSEKAKA